MAKLESHSKPVKSAAWHVLVMCPLLLIMSSCPSCAEDNECGARINYCPDAHSSTGDLTFVDTYPTQPMRQTVYTCFYLTCCTGDRPDVNTTWYKWMPKPEQPWKPENVSEAECIRREEDCRRYTSDHGQSLKFESGGVVSDSGKYMCRATDGRTTLERTFDVRVINCKENINAIKFSEPDDPQTSLGSVFTQDCVGDFGCKGAVASDSLAWWSYFDDKGHLQNLTVGKHGHYHVHEHTSEDETKKGAVLTIDGVTKEDFNRTFVCQLKMRNLTGVYNFSLTETGSRTAWRIYIGLIVGLGVSAAVIVIVVSLTFAFCRPVVVYKFRSTTNRLPKRKLHDVMLISREEAEDEEEAEDARVLQAMKDRLEQKGFSVYQSRAGSRAQRYDDVENCVSIIFIIATCRLSPQENYFTGFHQYFANAADAGTNMIFVSTQPMTKSMWEKLSDEYTEVYSNAPKVCSALTWPGEREGSGLKGRNFWCQLQQFLPKPRPGGGEECGDGGDSGPHGTRTAC